jgi:hypothetical protein
MLRSYFPTYAVEEPETHAIRLLGRGSYVSAGLLGCLYDLFKGQERDGGYRGTNAR